MWSLGHGVSILIDMGHLGSALDGESRLCEGWRKLQQLVGRGATY